MYGVSIELERREGRKTIRTLPVLRRQVAHRPRQVSWLRGHGIIAVNHFTFPSDHRWVGLRNGVPRNSGGTALGFHQLPY